MDRSRYLFDLEFYIGNDISEFWNFLGYVTMQVSSEYIRILKRSNLTNGQVKSEAVLVADQPVLRFSSFYHIIATWKYIFLYFFLSFSF